MNAFDFSPDSNNFRIPGRERGAGKPGEGEDGDASDGQVRARRSCPEALRDKKEPALGGELLEISIMFSDIKGFTSVSETLTPNQLAHVLGLYLEELSRIIQRETNGTIDKYIGDAIMTHLERARAGARSIPKWHAWPRCAVAMRPRR